MPQPGLTRRELLIAAAGLPLATAPAAAAPAIAATGPGVAAADELPVAGALWTSPIAEGVIAEPRLLATLADVARAQGALLHSPVPPGTRITYGGQPLGIVLAPEPAVAARAAQVLSAELAQALAGQADRPRLTMALAVQQARSPARAADVDSEQGQAERAFDDAAYRLKQTYACAAELPSYAAPLWVEAQAQRPLPRIVLSHPHEPGLRAALARWGKLPADWITIEVASPDGEPARAEILAKLAWSASSKLRRPVRLTLTAEQARVLGGQRPEVIQTLTLGAERSGRIVAWVQRTLNSSGLADEVIEPCGLHSRLLYDPAQVSLRHQLAPQSIGPASIKPAAGLLSGSFAVEVALDELAGLLAMDPLRLRIENSRDRDRTRPTSAAAAGRGPRARLQACCDRLLAVSPDLSLLAPAGSRRDGRYRLGTGTALGALPGVGLDEGQRSSLGCVLHLTQLRIAEGSARIEILSHRVVLHSDGLLAGIDRAELTARVQRSVQAAWDSALGQAPDYDPHSGLPRPAIDPGPPEPGDERIFASRDAIQVELIESDAATPPADRAQQAARLARLEALAGGGVTAALANAAYQATGYRQRTLPFDRSLLPRPIPRR